MALPVEDAPGDISWNAEDDEDRSPNHGGRWQGGARGPGRLGYDHGYDAEVFYLGLALDEMFVEGCLERIGTDDSDEEDFLQGIWEEGDDRGFVLEALKGGVDMRTGRP